MANLGKQIAKEDANEQVDTSERPAVASTSRLASTSRERLSDLRHTHLDRFNGYGMLQRGETSLAGGSVRPSIRHHPIIHDRRTVQPQALPASFPIAMSQENKSKQVTANEDAPGPSTIRNSPCTKLESHNNDIVEDINLRQLLTSKGPNMSKIEKLLLFRELVRAVDEAHRQGMGLMELQPSSFTVMSSGGFTYAGALVRMKPVDETNPENAKKRGSEYEVFTQVRFGAKKQKLDDLNSRMPETHSMSSLVYDKAANTLDRGKSKAHCISKDEIAAMGKIWMAAYYVQLEKIWYACPMWITAKDIVSFNVYCLGLLLFEFLCQFESMEAHSVAMMNLHCRILPLSFLSEYPKEAGFCFWLLHPEPSSRPTIREILQSELIPGSEDTCQSNDAVLCADNVDDAELDLLHHFLVSMKERKEDKASKLLETIRLLETDIEAVKRGQSSLKSSAMTDGDRDQEPKLVDHQSAETSYKPLSRNTGLRKKLFKNINQLEDTYLSMRSHVQLTEGPEVDRTDKDLLRNRDRLSWVKTPQSLPTKEESVDRVGTFFTGICKFGRYNKFEVCATLRNGDYLNSINTICSLSFDREEDYLAAAGVSKKIKIYEFGSLLDDSVDVQYPVLEMSNSSKFSCVCWNSYIRNYLVSSDYDGLVQMWDASTGKVIIQQKEHQKKTWCVDFSKLDPTKFASGSDDCSMKIWSINERNSLATIWSPSNVCSVQFSASSSHLLAFGSADEKIFCYDQRHTKIPWCTLVGHGKAVSYVKFLDAETLVSASTDSTLKLWDLKKTSLEGLSSNACTLTYKGHTNEKHFVGMAALDGYIACGSETNEVYAYYRSLPMPITSHNFGCIDPITGEETNDSDDQFVSSLCWRRKSHMVVAANSSGTIKVLRMA